MKCDIAKKCGSCQFINQGYVKSLEYKNEECKKIFKDLKVNVHPVSGMEDPYYYRNKTIIAFDKTYNYGLYEENSHRIIPYKSCLIHNQETDAIISIEFLSMIHKEGEEKSDIFLLDVQSRQIRH